MSRVFSYSPTRPLVVPVRALSSATFWANSQNATTALDSASNGVPQHVDQDLNTIATRASLRAARLAQQHSGEIGPTRRVGGQDAGAGAGLSGAGVIAGACWPRGLTCTFGAGYCTWLARIWEVPGERVPPAGSNLPLFPYTDDASRVAVAKLRLDGTPTPRSWVARMTKRLALTGVGKSASRAEAR